MAIKPKGPRKSAKLKIVKTSGKQAKAPAKKVGKA